jgi:hypothetical protein
LYDFVNDFGFVRPGREIIVFADVLVDHGLEENISRAISELRGLPHQDVISTSITKVLVDEMFFGFERMLFRRIIVSVIVGGTRKT